MKNLKTIIFLFLFFQLFFSLKGQTIQGELEKLENYNLSHPQEKIYLQLDKYAYTAGETIWFKAYTTIGIENLFSNLSGIAYVELIDAKEHKIDSLIIPLGLGVGLGDIVLSDTITEGSYRVRAYTNWMRNAGDKYFFDRTVQISNGRTDNVLSSTRFTEGDKNNSFSIKLSNLSGVPVSDTRVRYEIIHQGKSVERKRANTDEQGNLTIEIAKKYKDAQLSLRFPNKDDVFVNKLFRVSGTEAVNHVELLPEGGKLLAGFINTIGIKSINGQGLGQKVKLIFVNGVDTLGTAETNALGMGLINLFVDSGVDLKVLARYEDGSTGSVKIPEIYNSGFSIQVNNQNASKIYAQVNLSEDLVDGEELYFLVHHLGKVMFVSKQKANKQELSFSLPKQELPSGVLTISILNNKFKPVVERALFNYNKLKVLPVEVTFNKQSFGYREKVDVDLQVTGNDTLKVAALSASVLNVSKILDNPNTAPNILSGLLLSADLKGYIEQPGYYFEDYGVKSIDLDYLMLTQGWRNIEWNALDTVLKPQFDAEKSLSISGYTKKLGRSKPEIGAKVQMISTQNFMDFLDTTSNDDGYFNFNNLLFTDSIKFLISAKDEKGKRNIDIIYNKLNLSNVDKNRNGAEERWDINTLYQEEINHSKKYFGQLESAGLKEKAIMIEEVVVSAKKTSKASKHSSNLNGVGNADQVLGAEDLATCSSLEMCLSGRLTGVYWQAGVPYNTRGNVPMQVVFDGMFIEPDQISSISVTDVESIEVLRNANYTTMYGSNGANGLIIISSKTGNASVRSYTPKGIITIQPKGLHVNRVFYEPVYEVSNTVKYSQDLRTTILWKPSVVTNAEGKANFSFYTADEKGKYIVVIEGLDLFGNICRVVKEIEVK